MDLFILIAEFDGNLDADAYDTREAAAIALWDWLSLHVGSAEEEEATRVHRDFAEGRIQQLGWEADTWQVRIVKRKLR